MTEDELAGQQGECPFCKNVIIAPGKKTAHAPPAPEPSEVPAAHQDFPRCPKCGARRQEMKRTCGFCGAHLDEAAPQPKTRRVQAKIVAPRADSGPDRRKVVLIGLLLALVGVVAAVIFFTGGGEATPDYPPDEACRRTMILLDFSLQEYVAAGHAPPGTLGSQFWLTVVEEKGGPKRLKCPAGGGKGRMSDYRGPAKPYKELPNDGIIAATYPGDHPGGINVLLKNGTVLVAATDGELFKRAMAETKE